MPRISDLPTITTPDDADEIAIVDESASETKKISASDLATYVGTKILTDPDFVYVDGTSFATPVTISTTSPVASGYSLTIPSAGTWLVNISLRTRVNHTSTGRYIRARAYIDGVQVPGAVKICNYNASQATNHTITTVPISFVVTATAGQVIEIYGEVDSTSGLTYARFESDGNGYSTLTAVRIK